MTTLQEKHYEAIETATAGLFDERENFIYQQEKKLLKILPKSPKPTRKDLPSGLIIIGTLTKIFKSGGE